MLVTIDPTAGGAVTDQQAMAINMLRAIKAVATAAANSTPSVTPLTGASTLGTGNIITVIANTEAGGWTASSEDTIPASSYSASYSSAYLLDLYNSGTGKPSFPYHKISIRTNPTYLFNGQYSSYPGLWAYHGASSTNVFSTFSSGSSSFTSGPAFVVNDRTASYSTSYGTLQPSMGTFTLAVTASYMHIIHTNYMVCMGLRNTQSWEDNFADNPPVAGFSLDLRNLSYPNTNYFYLRHLSNTGTTNAATRYYNTWNGTGDTTYNNNPQTNTVTGQFQSGYQNSLGQYYSNYTPSNARTGSYTGPTLPLFYLSAYQNLDVIYGPVTDPLTQALVPCANPIIYRIDRTGAYNSGGKMSGLFKSMSNGGGRFNMALYYTAGGTYTVDNDPYYPVVVGPNGYDMFLVRAK